MPRRSAQKDIRELETYSLLQNILLGLTLAAPIGPVNVEIIQRGLRDGFRQALFTGAGAMCADATYLTLIFFGMTAFLNNAFVSSFLGYAGSFVLMYLGSVSLREVFQKENRRTRPPRRIFKYAFVAGYALAISSPMTIVWWTGIFGALMASQGPVKTSFSAFVSCLSILLGCFLWVLFLAISLHWGKKMLNDAMIRIVNLAAGLFLIGFGVYFLWRTLGA